MEQTSFLEMAIAIRMALTPEGAKDLWSIRFDNSTLSEELSLDPKRLSEKAESLQIGAPLFIAQSASVDSAIEETAHIATETGVNARLIAWEGHGIFVCAPYATAAWFHMDHLLGMRLKYPEKAPPKPSGRLANRVVVVTGSAQGFGKGIAEECACEGASVVVADLNEEAGAAFSDALNDRHGIGTSLFTKTDVTDLESLQFLAEKAVAAFGGIDMFIANAGVLKAGGLDELDERSFDLVTNVNYKAFFLCAKTSATVMKLQHTYRPDHFMDIIQVNSKSGLEGSNKNFAYAGSKFGSIGLAQSFAMELVPHNIKVNVICPGNYFEGPLWSDPDRGLFVQYLRAGKVPGAETVDDVKKFYTDKVPMKRGCTPRDVAKAILYIVDQDYETGQALPVTGGQVMLR